MSQSRENDWKPFVVDETRAPQTKDPSDYDWNRVGNSSAGRNEYYTKTAQQQQTDRRYYDDNTHLRGVKKNWKKKLNQKRPK